MNTSPQQEPVPLAAPRRRRAPIAIAVGVLLVGAAALAIAAKTVPEAQPAAAALPAAAITVEATQPREQTFVRSVAATGSIAARDELLVGSDASGVRLVEVHVDVGSAVRRGQLLARGDDRLLQAQIAQQQAQIRVAAADAAQADANLERAERIADAGVYSVEAVQTRRTAAQAAAAKLELARAQLRELEVHLAHTRVIAPADGVIARRSATVGAVMQPGTELFRLMQDGEVEWRAELPAHALAQVNPGATVALQLDDGRKLQGRVRLVAPTLDPGSRNGLVYVALPVGTSLRAGSHVRGEIVVGTGPALALPESAVLSRDGQAFVYALGRDDVARLTRVETGTRRQGRVEITGGISAEERVVATGAGFVKDGERVRVAAVAGGS